MSRMLAAGCTDLAAEQALWFLHARMVAALAARTPATPGIGDITEQGAGVSEIPCMAGRLNDTVRRWPG